MTIVEIEFHISNFKEEENTIAKSTKLKITPKLNKRIKKEINCSGFFIPFPQ